MFHQHRGTTLIPQRHWSERHQAARRRESLTVRPLARPPGSRRRDFLKPALSISWKVREADWQKIQGNRRTTEIAEWHNGWIIIVSDSRNEHNWWEKVVVLNLNDVRLTKLIVSVLNRVCQSLWCYKTGMWALTAAARRWTRERRRRTRQRLTDDEGGGGWADVTPLSGYRAISPKPKQICLITLSSHWQRRALSKNFFPYKFIFL